MKQFIFLALISFSFMSFHPIYISSTEIDYKEKERTIEIAIKVYSDDFQKMLSKVENKTIEIATKREHKNADLYIVKYLKNNFKLYNSKNKELEWKYVGRELDRNENFALWIYLKIDKVRKLKELKVYNNILIDYQDGQRNKISFRKNKGSFLNFNTYKEERTVQIF